MKLNSMEQKILDHLKPGANYISGVQLASELNICLPTIYKYLAVLANKGVITRELKPLKGGTSGDKVWETVIYKL